MIGNDEPALEAIYEEYHRLQVFLVYQIAYTRPGVSAISRLNNVCINHIQGSFAHYPCLCLCLGFSQIMRTLPFLLITLHFSQIGFTDDLTFMRDPPFIHCYALCFPRFSAKNRNSKAFTHRNARKRAYIL